MVTYKKLTTMQSDIYYDDELIGHVERIGNMYSIEVHYMTINLPAHQKRLIKGLIERLNKHHLKRRYKEMVMKYDLRNGKLYGKKYVEFHILD